MASRSILSSIDPDNPLWIVEANTEALINECRKLVKHYQWSEDTEISVLIMREYVHLMRVFQYILTDDVDPSSGLTIPAESKAKARECIDYLDYFVDEIIKEVERTVNN